MESQLLLQGIGLGLSLSLLVGPILIAILQASLEQGKHAGILVGAGIWSSDILFILSVYFGISYIQQITTWQGFEFTLGMIGGIVLIIFGVTTIFTQAPKIGDMQVQIQQHSSNFKLWLKGFLINTLNPFTLFFWMSTTSTIIADGALNHTEASLFYGSLLITIILTDTVKALFADAIRNRLKQQHVLLLRRISGSALIFFGIALFLRITFF